MINLIILGNLKNILLFVMLSKVIIKKMMILNILKIHMFNLLLQNILIILEPKGEKNLINSSKLLKNNRRSLHLLLRSKILNVSLILLSC